MPVLFGLTLANVSMPDAVRALAAVLDHPGARCVTGVFVNAHAARLASEDTTYRGTLARADVRLIDGTGVRLALLMRGERLRANLVGTDLVPALLRAPARRARRCFLFGGTEAINAAAAAHLARAYPNWSVAGRHHGFIDADDQGVVDAINASGADLVLVGLGNPLQERWMDRHAATLSATLCLGVGGLFHHWAGDLRRASPLVRAAGLEWLQLCLQQRARTRRYAYDIPVFLGRALRAAVADRASANGASIDRGRQEGLGLDMRLA